ncbi:MAG TPA: alpha/beta fold hydrolase [Myxococcota bacterium]|nr:alpha/beta fold hydrolase [Myxococcota bacterium]
MEYASVGGRRIAYEIHGEHPGTPLVLVMGVGGSCRGWLPFQVPAFAKSRRVVVYDHRGVGESDDDARPFTVADLAEDLVGLLDTLSIERAHVLGAFLGGMVAQRAALDHPARVERLALVGTYARPDRKRQLLLEQWKEMARADASQDLLMRNRLLWTLRDETLDDTELVDGMIEFFRRDGPATSAATFERQCDACLGHDVLDRLGEIAVPTLVLCGERDQLTPVRLHRELAAPLRDGRLVVLPYAGHLVEVETADRFNAVVEQFLDDEHPAPGSGHR